MVHTAVDKQKMSQYNNASKLFEQYINQLLSEQASDLNKITNNVDGIVSHFQTPSKLTKFKSPAYNIPQMLPLHI